MSSWSSRSGRARAFYDSPRGFQLMEYRPARRDESFSMVRAPTRRSRATRATFTTTAHLVLNRHFSDAWHEIGHYRRAHGASARQIVGDQLRRLFFVAASSLPGYRSASNGLRRRPRGTSWFTQELRARCHPTAHRPASDLESQLDRSVAGYPLPLYLRVETATRWRTPSKRVYPSSTTAWSHWRGACRRTGNCAAVEQVHPPRGDDRPHTGIRPDSARQDGIPGTGAPLARLRSLRTYC